MLGLIRMKIINNRFLLFNAKTARCLTTLVVYFRYVLFIESVCLFVFFFFLPASLVILVTYCYVSFPSFLRSFSLFVGICKCLVISLSKHVFCRFSIFHSISVPYSYVLCFFSVINDGYTVLWILVKLI